MKKHILVFTICFCLAGLLSKAQTNSSRTIQNNLILNHWFEAPESSSGDTIVFKLSKHVLGPNDDPSYAWSEFEIKNNNTFSITYWRWCPSGNYAYTGTWSNTASNKITLDFGMNKCKCEMQIISVNQLQLKAIIKETTN